MNLQPMQPSPLAADGSTLYVFCTRCNKRCSGADVDCDLDAPAGTYYCQHCSIMVAAAERERLADGYLSERALSDTAFRAGDGAGTTGHAAMAHAYLTAYAKLRECSTDDAAAEIRRRRR